MNDITLDFIQPGNPQQNACVERYNRTVRYDWLAQYIFKSIGQVQEHATQWLWTYNNVRSYAKACAKDLRNTKINAIFYV